MINMLNNAFGRGATHQRPPMISETPSTPAGMAQNAGDRKPAYSKIFRWRLPDGQTKEPAVIEIIGSFTHWQRVPLTRDGKLDSWHVTLHHIEGNKTHHYMLLVDGKPSQDKNCDGLAVPHGAQEEQFAIATARGPRVFMLFAQTK